jgi:hypothetical protein
VRTGDQHALGNLGSLSGSLDLRSRLWTTRQLFMQCRADALAPLAAISSAAWTVIFGGRSMGSPTILEATGRTCAGVIRLAQSRTIAANCSNIMEHPGNGDRAAA